MEGSRIGIRTPERTRGGAQILLVGAVMAAAFLLPAMMGATQPGAIRSQRSQPQGRQPSRPLSLPHRFTGVLRPASAQAGDIWVNPRDGAELVFVPAGAFLMGSQAGEPDERPEHEVYLDAFWIYRTPVTVEQYRRFYSETGHAMPRPPDWGWKDDHPVVNVSWEDAAAYCRWAGVRLPTEAEWEKAARGTDGRRFPWGDRFDPDRLQFSRHGYADAEHTAAVGRYPGGASPYGALDMAGNVWQWCADWYGKDYYRSLAAHGPARNPPGPGAGPRRVLRGGSWDNTDSTYFRTTFRDWYAPDPEFNISNVGFRGAAGR